MASIVIAGDTSGTVTLDAPLVAGTTTLTLPTVNGTVLTTTSPKTGNVLQVVHGKLITAFSTASTSLTSTGLTASITPEFSTSKILVRLNCFSFSSNTALYNVYLGLDRGGVYLNPIAGQSFWTVVGSNNNARAGSYVTETLDSPATTSSITYTASIKVDSGGTAYFNSVFIGNTPTDNPTVSTITLMEIAA
jgi:hypothetical protein